MNIFRNTPNFAIFGEKGRKGNYGMSGEELSRRYRVEQDGNASVRTRLDDMKCQSANFAAQIASTSIVALQYDILSAVKRFTDYETIGELFRQATRESHEPTISERIWLAILELVAAIAKVFSTSDEEVLEAMVNESDELAHICELYQSKNGERGTPET